MSAATQYAHQRGLRVSGHVPAFMRAEDAVRQGFDEIQHINQVLLNFFVKPKDDTRTLARFYIVAENAHGLSFDSPQVRDFIALLQRGPTVVDPTLACFEGQFVQRQGEMNPSYAAIASHLPAAYQRGLRTNSMNVTEANVDRYRKSFAKMVEFVGVMHRAGIPIVAGTDAVAGFTLHRELELYVQAGIPPGRSPAHRHLERRQVHPHARPPGIDHTRQARRSRSSSTAIQPPISQPFAGSAW